MKRSLIVALLLLLAAPAAFAQTAAEAPLTAFGACPEEPDANTMAMNYSLYYENYKNEDYASALPYLRWMLRCAPAYAGPERTGDKNLTRAVTAYEALAEEAPEETKRAYLDTALVIITSALDVLEAHDAVDEGDPYTWTFKRGYFLHQHGAEMPDHAGDIAGAYLAAYEVAPEKMDPYYLDFILRDYMERGDMQNLLVFLTEVKEQRGDEPKVEELVAKYMPAIPPNERIKIIEEMLEKRPDDVELITDAMEIYEQMGNRAKLYELGERLLDMEPSAKVYRSLANMYLKDGEAAKAFDMYEDMTEMPGYEPQADDYYNMGIAQRQMDRLSTARTYFRRAIELDPDYGRAYLAIGDLYVSAIGNCGSMEREDRAVYWLATDYYEGRAGEQAYQTARPDGTTPVVYGMAHDSLVLIDAEGNELESGTDPSEAAGAVLIALAAAVVMVSRDDAGPAPVVSGEADDAAQALVTTRTDEVALGVGVPVDQGVDDNQRYGVALFFRHW